MMIEDIHNEFAPRGAGTTDVRRTQKQATAAASTAAVDTLATEDTTDQGGQNKWLVDLVCDQDCYIRFGDAAVAAATSDDYPLYAKVARQFVLDKRSRFFRVIRASADGTLKWFCSH